MSNNNSKLNKYRKETETTTEQMLDALLDQELIEKRQQENQNNVIIIVYDDSTPCKYKLYANTDNNFKVRQTLDIVKDTEWFHIVRESLEEYFSEVN